MHHLLRIFITLFFVPHFFISAYGYEIMDYKIWEYQPYDGKILKMLFSPDGGILYTYGSGGGGVSIKALNFQSGEFLENIHNAILYDISNDGQYLLIGESDSAILWSVAYQSPVRTFSDSYSLHSARLSIDNRRVYTSGAVYLEGHIDSSAVIKTWDAETSELLNTNIRPSAMVKLGEIYEEVTPRSCGGIDLSPDGNFLYASYGFMYEYYPGVWVGMGYGELTYLDDWQTALIVEGGDSSFSPDKKHWATEDKILDLETQTWVHSLEGLTELFNYSPNGKYILGKSSISYWGTIWDADTGQPIVVMPATFGYSTAGAWSPDGSKVVIGGWDGTITVWDVIEFVESSVGKEAEAYGK